MTSSLDSALPAVVPPLFLSRPIVLAVGLGSDCPAPTIPGLATLLEFADGSPVIEIPGWGPPVILRQLPAMLVAILMGPGGAERTERLLHWLDAAGAATRPAVLEWSVGHEAAAVQRLTRELAQYLSRSAGSQRKAVREALRLRTMNAELRYRFALAESTLQRRGGVPFDLQFASEPVIEPAPFDLLNESAAGLSQILPAASKGVAAIGLHFATLGDGELDLRLLSLEDARLVERWSVRGEAIKRGWNIFGLSRVLSGLNRTLELRIMRANADDRLPLLSLAAAQPIPTYQVRDLATRQPALPRNLALQVWSGIPGTHLPASVDAFAPNRKPLSGTGFDERPIPAAIIKLAEHANAEEVSFDFRAVMAPPGENVITCHPPSAGITLGQLIDASPQMAVKVSASVVLSNEKSREVDFGLVVTDGAARALDILRGVVEPEPNEGFSGWMQVNNRQSKRLSAFRESGSTARNVYIATRMSKAGDNSFAWAQFKDFTYMVRR